MHQDGMGQEEGQKEEEEEEEGRAKKTLVASDETAIPDSSGRPFEYLGDIDPSSPAPWPKSETDWWKNH